MPNLRRDRHAAARFFRRLLKRSGRRPGRLVTDRFGSYRAAHRLIMPSVVHDTTRYARRFLAVHDIVRNLFTVGRHRLRAGHQRLLRARAFMTWNAVAAA